MYKVGIITASDKAAIGEREDKSNQVIQEMVKEQGWEVTEYKVLPDNQELLENIMVDWCDNKKVDLLITTGGTGFADRKSVV